MTEQPTEFFKQHHAVEAPSIDDLAFRPFWRVRTRLDQLFHDRAISVFEHRAGEVFRQLAEIVLSASWRSSSLDRSDGGGRFASGLLVARRLDAIAWLNDVKALLGAFAFDILEAHAVEDESWKNLGARLGVHPKTARAWTIVALKALAAVMWDQPQKQGDRNHERKDESLHAGRADGADL